ncbi:hypothetical protein AC578_3089 [Pseudocercospora eumusae]|uniref:Beta-xylosidase C-terminal Concanavalin A-like domain-containing protein n=1 Tax=Pseudocercospora eumusae TaxID=321146 RepID=A0A139H1R9_9PEZI|nr:hypothetical protein AC578_3089 [Pseudocercospora eumusae]
MMRYLTATTTALLAILPRATTFNNPPLWNDLADLDIFRVGNVFYYSASSMHFSPGAPLLQSYDLVNWQYIANSVPTLDFGPEYSLPIGQRAYARGTWASAARFRKSNGLFYWYGCVDYKQTYVYTAPAAEGPWTRKGQFSECLYDAGLLIDDDDTMYIAYGSTTIKLAQLSPDGLRVVRDEAIHTYADYAEGSRVYKRNGAYYVINIQPVKAQYVIKSTTGPFGKYEQRTILDSTSSPIAGGSTPHQGGLVDTPAGDWYYMAFTDVYPGGRVPVLAPISWDAQGWPTLQLGANTWPATLPNPNVPTHQSLDTSVTGSRAFSKSGSLAPEWQWNHNPDTTKWALEGSGVRLRTATITDDLHSARNTLTHRVLGPSSAGTAVLDVSQMAKGDRAGLSLLRDQSAYIGVVVNADGSKSVVMRSGITMVKTDWKTTSVGKDEATAPISTSRIWLRAQGDFRPAPSGSLKAQFLYSLDGLKWQQLGSDFTMPNGWEFFQGIRWGVFNYATTALGGSVLLQSFTVDPR